jgi:flagellar biosynthesis component FlhA
MMVKINKSDIYERVEELRAKKMSVSAVASQLSNELSRNVPIKLIREVYEDIKEAKKNISDTDVDFVEATKNLER